MIYTLADGTKIDLSKIFAVTTSHLMVLGALDFQFYFHVCSEYHYIKVEKTFTLESLSFKGQNISQSTELFNRFQTGGIKLSEIDQYNHVVALRDQLVEAWQKFKIEHTN